MTSDHDEYETHRPTCELRWFRTDAMKWGEVPLAVTYDHEGVSDHYRLKQKWVSDIAGIEPEWRDIEVVL